MASAVMLPEHPATALFPLLSADDLGHLAADIRVHGLLSPIVLHEGCVLDGRNRLRACELAGVEPRFVDWSADGLTPTEWVVATNLHRRHLTPGQRATVAVEMLPLLEAEARERQGRRTDLGTSAQICAEVPTQQGKASQIAAAQVGVSARSVEMAKHLREHDPAGFEAVKEGSKTLNAARLDSPTVRGRHTAPPQPKRTRESIEATQEQIVRMARDGYGEAAIAAEVGLGEQRVRGVLYERGVPTLAARIGSMRRFDDTKAMEGLVTASAPLPEVVAAIDWDALDRARFGDWEARLSEAIRVLTGLRNRLRKG